MMKRFLPLLPLLAGCLFACGAAEPNDPVANAADTTIATTKSAKPAGVSSALPNRAEFRPTGAVDSTALTTPNSAPDDWRKVAADQLILVKTPHGTILIELASAFAPGHVARFSELAREGHFAGLPFHRVLEGFMAQAGDTYLVGRAAPATKMLTAEFRFRRSPEQTMNVVGERRSADAGFIDGFKVASQSPLLAMMTADGKVDAWQLHCPGAVAAARLGNNIHSANAQFYITMGYPENLDKNYTVWGRVRAGLPSVYRIKRGEPVMPPDLIAMFTLVSDLDAGIAPEIWVMDTNSAAFTRYLDSLRTASGILPDICKIDVPVIVRWPDNSDQ